MVFSADHMNDPERVRAMCDEGFLTIGRRDALLDFPWHHDVIFHEAGIPPIHTPMRTLQVRFLGCPMIAQRAEQGGRKISGRPV